MKRAKLSNLPDKDVGSQKDLASQKLRKELKIWKKLKKATPFCLAAALSFFVATGGAEKSAQAAEAYVNYEQYSNSIGTHNGGSPGYYTYTWGGYANSTTPRFSFDESFTNGGVIQAINYAGGNISGGGTANGTAYITETVRPSDTLPGSTTNLESYTRYRSAWGDDPNHNSNAGATAVNIGGNVVLLDQRSSSTSPKNYLITTLTKNGTGTLSLSADNGNNAYTTFTSSYFEGNAGGLTVDVSSYTSQYTNFNGTFTGTVGSGYNWNANALTVAAGADFTKAGAGTLASTTSNINGTANMTAGSWTGSTMNVGYTSNGILNITGGTTTFTNTYVGGNSGATGVVEMTGGIWNTTYADIGAKDQGTVTIGGTSATQRGRWNAGTTRIAVDAGGDVTIEQYGTWNSSGQTDVGYGSGMTGTVTLDDGSIWNASGQVVNVGTDGTGIVDMANSTWTNGTTNLGMNASGHGTVNQTAGTHTDTNANIGVSGVGEYNLIASGTGGATWNTLNNAVIGVNPDSNGAVNIDATNGDSYWKITNNLTVANEGLGLLDISNGGVTEVVNGNVVVGVDDSYYGYLDQGTVNVTDDGSSLLINNGNLTVAQGGQSVMNITNEGLVDVKLGGATIGELAGVMGTVNVEDAGSLFHVQNGLTVGDYGDGNLNILNGARTVVTTGDIVISDETASTGTVTVDGSSGGDDSTLVGQNGNIIVGDAGTGELNVTNGGLTQIIGTTPGKGNAIIGNDAAGTGTANIDGTNSRFLVQENLIVANNGLGNLNVTNGGYTEVTNGEAVIGENNTGIAKIDGTDGTTPSTLQINEGNLTVARNGDNSEMTVSNGGLVDVQQGNVIVGENAGITGTINVTDPDSLLNIQEGNLTVGDAGTGNLNIRNGGVTDVLEGNVVFAEQAGSTGNGLITGDGSQLNVDEGNMTVGKGGDGKLDITLGGLADVKLGDVIIGDEAGSYGETNVNGTGSKLNVEDGNVIVARNGDGSNLNISNGGLVEITSTTDPTDTTKGNLIVGEQPGVHGDVTNAGPGSKLDVQHDVIIGEEGIGTLTTSNQSETVIGGDLITGNQNGSIGSVWMLSGSTITVDGNDIIGNETGSFGHQLVSGNGTVKTVVGTQVVGNEGQAGGRFLYYTGAMTTPTYLVDPSPSSAWAASPNMTLTPEDTTGMPNWSDVKNNAPGLAITNGGQEVSGRGEVGSLAGGYGYVLLDDKGTNAGWTTKWDVEKDMLIGGEGEAYVRVLNGAQLNVGIDGQGDGTLTIGQAGGGPNNDGGTLRVEGYNSNGNKAATVTVEVDMIIGQENKAEGNLYASDRAVIEVGNDMIISVEEGSLGRAHFDGRYTTGTVGKTIVVGDAGQAGQRYQYGSGNNTAGYANAGDPTQWFDSANTLNFVDSTKTTELPYGTVARNNMPGFSVTNGAVVGSTDGVIGNASSGYGYVVIDNKSSTASAARATWNIDNNLVAGNEGDAYVRVLNGGLLNVDNDMTVAKEAGSTGTVRVNGVNPNRTSERATVDVTNDLVIAQAGTAEGNLYAYNQGNVIVGNDMIVADEANSLGRAHFDGEKTTGNVTGALVVGDAGKAGQRYQYVDANGNTAGYANLDDPTKWFDSDQTLDSLNTGSAARNNMPGMVVSDGAVVTSGIGIVGNDADGYGYVVIDNRNGGAMSTRATWNVETDLTVANAGDAYLRVLNGGLLDVDSNMIVADKTGSEGTVRVNGTNPTNGERSTLDVGGNLTVANENGTNGNLYLYDKAEGNVDENMTIADKAGSNGRAHIDGFGTTLDVGATLTVGLSGNAGKEYQYVAGQYTSGGKDAADPEVWFDSAQTLNPLAGNFTQNNAPGLLISDAAVVTSYDGMIGDNESAIGYVVVDGRLSTANGRSTWTVTNDLTVADEGWAYVRVNHGALLEVGHDLITADSDLGEGTIRVYGVNANGTASQLNVGGDMITANDGDGNFYLYDKANSTVNGNYTIAADVNSHGRAQIDGDGTWMRVDETVTIGQYGQAGGVYAGDSDKPNPKDPENWFDSDHTLVDLAGSSNLLGNAPGLLISAGGKLSSGDGVAAEFDGSNGYMVIDGKDAGSGRSWWKVDNNLNFGQAGNAYGRVFNGALLEIGTVGGGNMIIADEGTATSTMDVYGVGTELLVHGDLTTAKQDGSKGNLYLFKQATAVIDGNHIIADEAGSLGRDYVDGVGTTMTVAGTLTVGNAGQAGGTYTENRYDPRYGGISGNFADGDPAVWFDAPERTMDLVSAAFAQTDNTTGNTPGLAITRGAQVFSGAGMVGNAEGSNGYVVIDHKGIVDNTDPKTRTQWVVSAVSATGTDGNLAIANSGTGFVRVLNGALLETDSLTMNEGGGDGTLHVIGNGALKDEDGNYVQDPVTGQYTALEHDGFRTQWINHGAAALGLGTDPGKSTIRINDGGYGETHGLYIGLEENSQGAVSVMGAGSMLHIYKDEGSLYEDSIPKGSATLSVSDRAWVFMDEESQLLLNGNGMFSNAAVLHLENGSVLDAMTDRVSFVNARIEGIGTVTGQKGVFVTQDDIFTPEGQAEIDPGLAYGWAARCDNSDYYGTLTFGDQLIMDGNVITYFDVSRGFSSTDPVIPPQQDLIVVKRGTSPGDAQVSQDPIVAELSGTLMVHARLTDYYEKDSSFLVVDTEGDSVTGDFVPGRILSTYDTLDLVPHRFFNGIEQEVRQDVRGNDDLWVSMERKDNPFEEAGITYNQKQTGSALDSIYAEQNQDWLPFLRHFWYLGDPEFLNAYKDLSGEVRAHSMMMAMRSPWRYIQDRVDSRRHCFDEESSTPCDQIEVVTCRPWEKRLKGYRIWGSAIYEDEHMSGDGNASGYDLTRQGLAVGIDYQLKNTKTYFGFMFAYDDGKLDTYKARAESDDFNFGLYHKSRFRGDWEWKNYLGMGYQDYDMWRDVSFGLAQMEWNGDKFQCYDEQHGGRLNSSFKGYSFAASTELAKVFTFGCRKQHQVRPYVALDLMGTRQRGASEHGNFDNIRYVALNYHKGSDMRVYFRPGVSWERGGPRGVLRAQAAYSFLMGGHSYARAKNQFQYGGDTFTVRSVDDGIGYVTVNFGASAFMDQMKTSMLTFDYWLLGGDHSTTHALQLGVNKKF